MNFLNSLRLNASFRVYQGFFSHQYSQVVILGKSDEGKEFIEKYHKNIAPVNIESSFYLNYLSDSVTKEHPEKIKPVMSYLGDAIINKSYIRKYYANLSSHLTGLTNSIMKRHHEQINPIVNYTSNIYQNYGKVIPFICGPIMFYLFPVSSVIALIAMVPLYDVTRYHQSVNILIEEFKKDQ